MGRRANLGYQPRLGSIPPSAARATDLSLQNDTKPLTPNTNINKETRVRMSLLTTSACAIRRDLRHRHLRACYPEGLNSTAFLGRKGPSHVLRPKGGRTLLQAVGDSRVNQPRERAPPSEPAEVGLAHAEV